MFDDPWRPQPPSPPPLPPAPPPPPSRLLAKVERVLFVDHPEADLLSAESLG